MAMKLNEKAYAHAKKLIADGRLVVDGRDEWSAHQPSAADENSFIAEQGFDAYALWHLGVDRDASEATKGRYKFPYGDFEKVHRCGVLAVESRAGQRKYLAIELAAAHLHGLLESLHA